MCIFSPAPKFAEYRTSIMSYPSSPVQSQSDVKNQEIDKDILIAFFSRDILLKYCPKSLNLQEHRRKRTNAFDHKKFHIIQS